MAKRYYWLKLKEDFFEQRVIKKLRKIAGGDTYTIIYLKLQLLAMKNEGKLVYEGIEDDFISEMALELDEEVENVRITLMFLEKNKLIETLEGDEYLLPEVLSSTGSENASAMRVREHRERKKALHCNTDVTKVKQVCNVEKEKEKEKEKINKKEKSQEKVFDEILGQLEREEIDHERKEKLKEWVTYRQKEIKKPLKTYRPVKSAINSEWFYKHDCIEFIDWCMSKEWQGLEEKFYQDFTENKTEKTSKTEQIMPYKNPQSKEWL